MRQLMRAKLALVAVTALLAAPAAAQDADRVVYRGKTSQDRNTVIFATPDGDITKMRMGWIANCRRSGAEIVARTKFLDPIEQSGNQLSDSGTYTDRDPRRNVRYRITGSLEGTFDAASGGQGSARYRVRVRRSGRLLDRCRTGELTWSVSRVG